MEKTDKSAEDYWFDFSNHGTQMITEANFKAAIRACQKDSAAQQLSEYKERLKNSLLSWASVGRGKDSEDLINDIVILIDKLQPTPASSISEYKEVIKELLPLATSSKLTVDDPNWRELWENKKTTIDRAKKLI